MAFYQDPPSLPHPFDDDPVLPSYLERVLPADVRREIEPGLREMGALAAGELLELFLATRGEKPSLTGWDAWGHRVDRIELTRLWQRVGPLAAEKGLIAIPYERTHGPFSRIHQMALAYLFEPSSGVYGCPLAMTDGAAKTLVASGNLPLAERALPRLTSRDPRNFWTSGQWMTERTGGSDVGISEASAAYDGSSWRLSGTKWFTSATTSEMALTLARPEGNPPGGAGLALFYLETRLEDGQPNGIQINRLKDKLGTWMVPTAEVLLDGARAVPVQGLSGGVKAIATMLNVTRLWNSVAAVSGMRRAVALARDYARRRVAFGEPLSAKPLHQETLADLEALSEGAFLLTFRVVELVGRDEAEGLGEEDAALLRILTPIAKLTTGKQAVVVASEALEAFGGAGYVEDTGLSHLLRDAQVLPIWEGTTNVLSLEVLKAAKKAGGLAVVVREVERALAVSQDTHLAAAAGAARSAVLHAQAWLGGAASRGPAHVEAGARRLALTLGAALETAYAVEQAAFSAGRGDERPALSARRLARLGIDRIQDDADPAETRPLAV